MKSERSIRGLACRWCSVVGLALLCSLISASAAHAQVQTFFVNEPAASEQREAMELCRDRFTAALVRVGGFRANQDAVTQQSVTDCLGETASATAKRECEVSMANIEVDFVFLPTVRRLGNQWNWSIKALSPAQGAAQVWGGDGSSIEADASKAAYDACEGLAKEFACEQGVERACSGSGFGGGPLLGADTSGTTSEGIARAAPRRVNVSALDVFDVVPTEVAVWIDGKESGTSASQVTGIPPGEHEVVLKATGYFDQSQRVAFEAGKASVVQGVRLKKTTASLIVTMADPSEATVLVGGRERGRSGMSLAGIAPGTTTIVVRAPGYRERSQEVLFVADEEARVERVVLEPLPATITVTANIMGAEVLVDGQVVGETTGEDDAFEVAPTAQQLEVRRSGYVSFVQRLSLRPGGAAAVSATVSRAAVTGATNGGNSAAGGKEGCPTGYVLIAPGTFSMGSSPGEDGHEPGETQHTVTITRAFCMKTTEVTQGEWIDVKGRNPSYFKNCGSDCPVEQVSWNDVVGYANALSRNEGLPECYIGSTFAGLSCIGYRLPTEAEWEYAARGGTTDARYLADRDSVAWSGANAGGMTHPVSRKQPNAWGLYDMLGNVFEWTGDWFDAYSGAATDPTGAATGTGRVVRGGSWYFGASWARAATRLSDPENSLYNMHGFRLVRAPLSEAKSAELLSSTRPKGSSEGASGGCPAGYVRIEPGTFTMGSPPDMNGRENDVTEHSVTITRAYCMKTTEVTHGEWRTLTMSNPAEFKNCGENCPVENVSWNDVIGYSNALSRREGLPECYSGTKLTGLGCTGYRLPTESEWEYAARAGSTDSRHEGLDFVAWYKRNAHGSTHLVRQKEPNAWGLYDMLGNVWEWTGDFYNETYPGTVTDPTGAATGSGRAIRGGAWDTAGYLVGVASRARGPADLREKGLGFRLVRNAL